MAIQLINTGAQPNDASGDSLREGGQKINFNFQEIYSLLGDGENLFAKDLELGQIKLLFSNSVENAEELSAINPQTYQGLLIHVQNENAIYYASGFSWIKLLTDASTSVNNYTDSLSPVAYTGDFNDLSNSPNIPLDLSELTDVGQIYAKNSALPVRITDLNIEDGFAGQVLATDGNGNFSFVTTSGSDAAIGLGDLFVNTTSPNSSGSFIYNNLTGEFTFTPPNLSIYATISSLETIASTGDYIDLFNTPDLSVYALLEELSLVATSNDYNDLNNIPAIPSDTGDLTNIEGYIKLDSLSVANAQASGNGSLNYNTTTGIFTYTPPDIGQYVSFTDLSVIISGTPAGSGSLAYDNELGVFTFTPPNLTPYALTSSLANVATSGSFIDITNKPTTIAGYGITDAFDETFTALTGKPTTISGYGITDAFNGTFTALTGKPITISGYGITDAVLQSELGSFTFTGSILDTDDSSGITVTPAITFSSDATVENNLYVTNTIVANEIYVSNFVLEQNGTPQISSETELLLNAERVAISSGLFKLNNVTTAQRDALFAENGDMIYNSSTNKFQGYANGVWVDLH